MVRDLQRYGVLLSYRSQLQINAQGFSLSKVREDLQGCKLTNAKLQKHLQTSAGKFNSKDVTKFCT